MRSPFFPLLLAAALTSAPLPGVAQPAESGPESESGSALPAWVVPVLRLVSSTHVEPTTGVVLSPAGLVLVPLEFAAPDDEIVVLDGGTDIIRHGRPARLERTFPELGLKVLAVQGLNRSAARPAAAPPDGGTVSLAAFPPAEGIEQGAPPLRRDATVRPGTDPGEVDITEGGPLPNVSGALLDACGNLAGYSVANGVQSMAPSADTRYHWAADLRTVLEQLGLPSNGVPCRAESAQEEAADAAPVEEPLPAEPSPPPAEVEPVPQQEPAAAAEPEPEIAIDELPPLETSEPPAEPAPAAADDGRAGPAWGWLAAALVLIAAGLAVHRLRSRARPPGALPHGSITADAPQPGHDGARDETGAPAADCRLLLRGQYADGRPLVASAGVSGRAINLEIGRGGADIALDSPAVSRRHARLNGSTDALTLSDLGSSNGSSINGVPCLEGEILFIEPGDSVILGDVRFTVVFEPAGDGGDPA